MLVVIVMLLYRDRRVKKEIRQLQNHLKSNNESQTQHGIQNELNASVYGEVELDIGVDRGELRADHDHHEAFGRQIYEMI